MHVSLIHLPEGHTLELIQPRCYSHDTSMVVEVVGIALQAIEAVIDMPRGSVMHVSTFHHPSSTVSLLVVRQAVVPSPEKLLQRNFYVQIQFEQLKLCRNHPYSQSFWLLSYHIVPSSTYKRNSDQDAYRHCFDCSLEQRNIGSCQELRR